MLFLIFMTKSIAQTVVTDDGDSGAGTLREAVSNATTGGTETTITFDSDMTITLSSAISLSNKSIVLDGEDNDVVIDANNNDLHFDASNGIALTIKNLTLQNGKNFSPGEGGSILSSAHLTLDNVTFTGNQSSYGAAIHADSTLIVTNCTFESNFSNNQGGAIFSDGKRVEISHSEFLQNEAALKGGAIYNVDDSVFISNSMFDGNFCSTPGAKAWGGAICNLRSQNTDNSVFVYLEIVNCTFVNNYINPDNTNSDSHGGAIWSFNDWGLKGKDGET